LIRRALQVGIQTRIHVLIRQLVFEFHKPQKQRHYSRLFDERDRFFG
jgi:hypothetical protein